MHSLAAPAGHSSHSTPRPSLEGPGRRLAELLAALADADGEQSHAGLPAGGASGAPKERVGSMIAARVDDQIGAGGLDGDAAWDGLPEDGYLPHPVDDAPWISASRATSGKLTLVEIAACVAGDRTPGSFVGAPSAPRSFSTDALLAEHRVEVAVVDTSPVDEDEIHVLVPSAADSSDAVAVEPSPHHFSPSVPASPAASFSVQAAAKRRVRLPPELVAPIIAFLKLPRDILAAGKVGRDWWTTAKVGWPERAPVI